jgi:hypothetical protein
MLSVIIFLFVWFFWSIVLGSGDTIGGKKKGVWFLVY